MAGQGDRKDAARGGPSTSRSPRSLPATCRCESSLRRPDETRRMAETNGRVETRFWKRPNAKRARRIVCLMAVLAPAIYFAPVVTLFLVLCGVIDVGRHRNVTYELIEKYFMGSGIGTWMLSPLNLVADLLSFANPGIHKLEDMPAEHRREIEACVREFVANGDRVKAHMAKRLKQSRRGMLTFKWLNVRQDTELRIPAFEGDYRYIQTIAVSAFNVRESTMRHLARCGSRSGCCTIWSRPTAEKFSSRSTAGRTTGSTIRSSSSTTRCSIDRSTMWTASGIACSWISFAPIIRELPSTSR